VSTDRVELRADDFAAVLGGVYRVRQARITYYRERAFVLCHALGCDHPTTQTAVRMYLEAMQREAA
jgi:hypothetical protein